MNKLEEMSVNEMRATEGGFLLGLLGVLAGIIIAVIVDAVVFHS